MEFNSGFKGLMLLLPERKQGEAWEPSNKQLSVGNRTTLYGKVLSHFMLGFKLSICLLNLVTEIKFGIHEEKSNKMQQCIKLLLFRIYMKLNMFRATHRPSSGA